MGRTKRNWTRREFVDAGWKAPLAGSIAGLGAIVLLEPTPACGDEDDPAAPTPRQTEGPYFKPSSPKRASLVEKGYAGRRLIVEGRVVSTTREPVAKALLDFWHCDENGVYDNDGYKYRGHEFASKEGRYRLETIVPGLYPGRTRHIHVKVQAPDNPVLTTQLYFPGENRNRTDGIFNKALLVRLEKKEDHDVATFDFVLKLETPAKG